MSTTSEMFLAELTVRFSGRMAARLRREAVLRGVTGEHLALHLLRTIINEQLYAAVLDGGPPRSKKR